MEIDRFMLESKCNFVCGYAFFNFNKITERGCMKFGTIDRHFAVIVVSGW